MCPSLTRLAGNGQTSPYVTVAGCVVRALVQASHPEPAVAVTAVTALLAWGVGHDAGRHRCGSRAAVLASQLAIGWVNDWLDADRDPAVGRTDKPVATGAIDRRTVGICGARGARWPASLLALFPGWPAGAADDRRRWSPRCSTTGR